MNEEDLKSLFSASNPQPSAEKKKADIEHALAAFKEEFAESNQGNTHQDRPKENQLLSFPPIPNEETNRDSSGDLGRTKRSEPMSEQASYAAKPNLWRYTSVASAAVVVLAVLTVIVPGTVSFPGRPNVDATESTIATGSQQTEFEEVGALISEPVVADAALPELLEAVKSNRAISGGPRKAEAEFRRVQQKSPLIAQTFAPGRPAPVPLAENRDSFEVFAGNPVKRVAEHPVSTFSIDVDTASYSFVRRQLLQGLLPQQSAVRLEEMVNYFNYDYPKPERAEQPFRPTISVLPSPWNPTNRLVHIGIKGYEKPIDPEVRSNLVFLLDVSGSMSDPDKLPLVKSSLRLLLAELHPEDTVAIVVYAGAAGTVLEPTKVKNDYQILEALDRLQAGGSTAGGQGIRAAYRLAEANYIEGGINRILLATDGDFNVGITDPEQLKSFVARKRNTGVYLSVLGFGQGNYQDDLMQTLAQNGNGIASYIDSWSEARKVLVDEARAQLFPIANDVKLQVAFNPATVSEYRLLGYETRLLKREDFNNDKVDAGEIGSGHTVTAIYEITPVGSPGLIEPSRYETAASEQNVREFSGEYGYLEVRHKVPGGASQSYSSGYPIPTATTAATTDVKFSVAVAGFAQLLKGGKYLGNWGFEDAAKLVLNNRGDDPYGYRSEFLRMVQAAQRAEEVR